MAQGKVDKAQRDVAKAESDRHYWMTVEKAARGSLADRATAAVLHDAKQELSFARADLRQAKRVVAEAIGPAGSSQ